MPFLGEDGRAHIFETGRWPLPGWHESLATTFAVRVGPAGGLRTLTSATSSWAMLGRLIRFLGGLPDPPLDPGSLRVSQLVAFRGFRATTTADFSAWAEVKNFGYLVRLEPLRDSVSPEVLDYVTQRVERQVAPGSRPGYSDGELRRVLRAARQDVAALSQRIRAGERLLRRWRTARGQLSAEDAVTAELLSQVAETGAVPMFFPGVAAARPPDERAALARRLFLVREDLMPLMVLLVAVTARNIETIKELPAEHTVLEGRAVHLDLIKRRRGKQHWHQSTAWEIGSSRNELTTPGSVYLLLHRLTARGRAVSGSESIWSMWQDGYLQGVGATTGEHRDPFAANLTYEIGAAAWAARHGLTCDDDTGRLSVHFGRIRTSVEVRRTKQLGGHLPSAARSNTMGVLFRNYLRGDPTTLDWAQDVVTDAVADAERSALAAHRRALATTGGPPLIATSPSLIEDLRAQGVSPAAASRLASGRQDTAWTACKSPESHPVTQKPCHASFLDCFDCSNCVITTSHLPRLIGLLDALNNRRRQLGEPEWWTKYGSTWTALRHDILTKFTPAQIAQATATATADALLDLVETPWDKT